MLDVEVMIVLRLSKLIWSIYEFAVVYKRYFSKKTTLIIFQNVFEVISQRSISWNNEIKFVEMMCKRFKTTKTCSVEGTC